VQIDLFNAEQRRVALRLAAVPDNENNKEEKKATKTTAKKTKKAEKTK
jgi:hypothetical protein